MSYSKGEFPGGATEYALWFTYIDSSYIEVYVNGVLKHEGVDYTFKDAYTIKFDVAPAANATVFIQRNTPKSTKIVDFTDGSILSAPNLDLSSDQMFHIVQELYDYMDKDEVLATAAADATARANAARDAAIATCQALIPSFTNLPVYADNATAKANGKTAGMLYRTSTGAVMVVYN